MAESAMPESDTVFDSCTNAPPIPNTSMTEAIIRFLFLSKSTLLSISILKPLDAMIPKSKMEMPPITAVGIELMTAEILPLKPKMIAVNAAPR